MSATKCLLLIVVLLTSQLSSAFARMQPMQDCGMDMSSSSHIVHESASLMANTMPLGDAAESVESMETAMDCCDMPVSVSCCDSECQCSAFFGSLLFLHDSLSANVAISSANPLSMYADNASSPFIHQPKRPPITTIS